VVILGLGSNLGNRFDYLGAAVWKLTFLLEDLLVSGVWESAPLMAPGAPEKEVGPYLNMVMAGKCSMAPEDLLFEVKELERELGRKPRGLWCSREIDIDVLAIDDMVIETPELCVPHREMLKRDFVMVPLAEILPDWKYPVKGDFHQLTVLDIIKKQGFGPGEGLKLTDLEFV
jgi:2-amino-4-hydroxy-6-hydroxymethyldihydropteridine diphosphokinase